MTKKLCCICFLFIYSFSITAHSSQQEQNTSNPQQQESTFEAHQKLLTRITVYPLEGDLSDLYHQEETTQNENQTKTMKEATDPKINNKEHLHLAPTDYLTDSEETKEKQDCQYFLTTGIENDNLFILPNSDTGYSHGHFINLIQRCSSGVDVIWSVDSKAFIDYRRIYFELENGRSVNLHFGKYSLLIEAVDDPELAFTLNLDNPKEDIERLIKKYEDQIEYAQDIHDRQRRSILRTHIADDTTGTQQRLRFGTYIVDSTEWISDLKKKKDFIEEIKHGSVDDTIYILIRFEEQNRLGLTATDWRRFNKVYQTFGLHVKSISRSNAYGAIQVQKAFHHLLADVKGIQRYKYTPEEDEDIYLVEGVYALGKSFSLDGKREVCDKKCKDHFRVELGLEADMELSSFTADNNVYLLAAISKTLPFLLNGINLNEVSLVGTAKIYPDSPSTPGVFSAGFNIQLSPGLEAHALFKYKDEMHLIDRHIQYQADNGGFVLVGFTWSINE